MSTPDTAPTDIDGYIAGFPADVREILCTIRRLVHEAAPEVRETLSYRMPTFTTNGVLLHVAAFKGHIGLYPPVSGDARLVKAVAPFAGEKGNLRFPLDRPIPYDLIRRIVAHRLKRQRTAPAAKRG